MKKKESSVKVSKEIANTLEEKDLAGLLEPVSVQSLWERNLSQKSKELFEEISNHVDNHIVEKSNASKE